ncbi:tRNA modification GTPase MnmE [uncultured delta proteobacterium]|uniref:tRNA modification GTPase MnmE n=1 Tax=uncultured delta proteobacterium TaxID=34034 RepID=A0A212IWU5_9DELT|nr:tRNA modification GTPase MnmE [uncultured delta proteobacterium]
MYYPYPGIGLCLARERNPPLSTGVFIYRAENKKTLIHLYLLQELCGEKGTMMQTEIYPLTDTIVAVATPPGQGGIGIVRLSGEDSLGILRRLMAADPSHLPVFKPRYMRHGWVHAVSPGQSPEPLDEVLAVYMPGPASFTGEDVAEIHCHGGQAVLLAVVSSACALGARMAEKGEFTYRAFVNGKYDLTQAEAVAEIIAAPSRQGMRLTRAKLSGLLGQRVEALRNIVETLRARVALAIDFPEEEAESLGIESFLAELGAVRSGIAELLAGYKRARHWREGVAVILAGKVNMGKSSLLNALLGRTRAIVSPIPGTTRDFIEETLDIDGLQVRITDTAGLRDSADPVEREGVARALGLADDAELVLLVTDAAQPLDEDERAFAAKHAGRILLVRNKVDLLDGAGQDGPAATVWEGFPSVAVSARNGQGLEVLAATIRRMALSLGGASESEPEQGDIVPNLRQSRLLEAALAEAEALADDIANGIACDLFSVRLDAVAANLGEITGFAAPDAILGRIFSEFCIGK